MRPAFPRDGNPTGFIRLTIKLPDEKSGEQVAPLKAADIPAHAFEVPKLPDGGNDWTKFGSELLSVIMASGERGPWLHANRATLEAMRKAQPKMHEELLVAIHEPDEVH